MPLQDVRLAGRLRDIKPSSTLAITSKARKLKTEGKDVVVLAAGEPDFDTPDFIKQAAIEALKGGFTKYTPTAGTAELKKLICAKFKNDNGLDYALNQVVVSCGAKHSIYNALFVLVDKGDEVLIPAPYWVSYPQMVRVCEGVCRFIPSDPQTNFKISVAQLKAQITNRTKVLILNSPSNPCGTVYDRSQLEEIAWICVKHNIYVISDEIYEKIIFDGLGHYSIAAFNKDIYNLTVTVNGLSKSHSMTGWRIGYLGARQEIIEAISRFQDHSTSNPNSIAQKAAEAALAAGDDFSLSMCREFQKRRDYCLKRLDKMPKISYSKPQGAFYIFCDISHTGLSATEVANCLLDEKLVALIPGDSFGRDDYVRISFATGMQQLEKGFDRIEEWLKEL